MARLRRLKPEIAAMVVEEKAHGHAFLFVPVVIGAGAACWFSLPANPPFWPYLVACLVLAVAAIAMRHRTGEMRVIVTGLALFLSGMMLAQFENWRRGTVVLDAPVTTELSGVVERREVDSQGRWRYIVRVEKTAGPELGRPPERVALLARARHHPLAAGEIISGRARLSPPSGPALPGLHDFAFSSYFDGIGAVGFFYGAPQKEAGIAPSRGFLAEAEGWLFDLRGEIASRIRRTVPGDAGAFAAAIVTDERRAISEETTEALRLSGLAHIVAISGLNMALAAGIFFVGVRTVLSLFTGFAQAWPVKKIAAFGALLMATAYYLISGFGVSAERAYIMMAVMLVAVFFDRPSISLRNVALSALVILALSPSEILGPSFQMSFAATAALVAGYALWSRRAGERDPEPLPFRHPAVTPVLTVWKFVAGILITSLIGSVSTAIYSVEHFHRLATYGLAANLAAMPIISFIVMPFGLVGMLLMPFGLEGPCLRIMGMGLEAVIAIARHVAAWGGDVGIGRQHAWFVGLASAGFLLLTLLRTRLRIVGIPLMARALLLSWQERSRPVPEVLISEDGTLVAVSSGAVVATNRVRPPDFIYDQWKRALLIGDPEKPVVSKVSATVPKPSPDPGARLTPEEIRAARTRMEEAVPGRFLCQQRAWCATVTEDGVIVVAVEDGRYAGLACEVAHLVIAPRSRIKACRLGALILSGPTLRKTGSLEIGFQGNTDFRHWTAQAAMAGQGRPWTRHRHYDWRSRRFDMSLPEPVRHLLDNDDAQ